MSKTLAASEHFRVYELAESAGFAQRVIADIAQVELRLPDHTFTDRMGLKGPRRAAEFLAYGGHTDGDAFPYLPAERIACLADLVVIKNRPWPWPARDSGERGIRAIC